MGRKRVWADSEENAPFVEEVKNAGEGKQFLPSILVLRMIRSVADLLAKVQESGSIVHPKIMVRDTACTHCER